MTETLTVPSRRAGGLITAALMKQRKAEALAAYLASPKLCEHCSGPILPAPSDKPSKTRAKRFCSSRCSALFFQTGGPHRTRKLVRNCRECGRDFRNELNKSRDRTFCPDCWQTRLSAFGQKSKAEVHRRSIAAHARAQLNTLPRKCTICGYAAHVESAHKIPVASFPPSALVSEINHIDNVVWLCPNHHWEFDHGLLTL